MSQGLTSSTGGYRALRDYGSTSSSTIPDVNFAGFSPTEFISLSENIAHNIGSVKSSWQALEKAIKIIGTPKDNKTTREKVHQIQASTNLKIHLTSKDLQKLSVVVRRGDKQHKLQVEKLTSDFRTIVQMYSECQQQIANKMKATLLTNTALNQESIHDNSNNMVSDDNQAILASQQKLIQQNFEFERSMMLEREQRVRQIEGDVLDVNQIMKELSTLINQQGETIDTIESSIDHTTGNIEDGTSELIKASQSQAKYRRKVLILLAIAVIIGLIVTWIIVSQLKS